MKSLLDFACEKNYNSFTSYLKFYLMFVKKSTVLLNIYQNLDDFFAVFS